MANSKISALNSATSAQASQKHVIVSGGTNKQITHQTMFKGVPFYVEGTCRATATVAVLPSGSFIFDMYVKPLVGSSAAAGGSDIEIGIGTNSQYYAAPVPTSGKSMRRVDHTMWSDINRLQNASDAVVAAALTASANSSFVVGIGYFR